MDYKVILEAIKGKNVELRHDVDLSLISAYNMAKIENEMGVKSIYYIRFDCDYYNPLSVGSVKMLIDIDKMGHDIGLHVDSSQVKGYWDVIQYVREYEKQGILNTFNFTFHINTDITKSLTQQSWDGWTNKSLVDKYISDSRGEFDKTKLDWIKDNDNFTLLIHPEWWMHNGTKEEVIAKAIKEILP